ncbi:MAG: multidrug ABC transporter ATP-binding protein [Candidatus Pelagibacter sp.]|nr:multidrug ABC transporter ATP-binding protein [Candidatus Pelagibacter sp.]|tara:strand:- start:4847 stop:5767 length:921 start_codon:yes stop_codon:yes gene_type:complete
MENDFAIRVDGLTKKYGSTHNLALNNVDLRIPYGSIFGLLGPNGAGKSSFINILAGLTSKTSGKVEICGIDIDKNSKTARGAIGVVPQEINMDPFFSPIEIMNIQAGLYGIKKNNMINIDILKELNLEDKANAYSRSLSGGMKRRLMVAKAMVHSPPVLVLDEPTAGVDVDLRKKLWTYIKKLNKNGVTIILTTHYLEEAEKVCDYITIINKGMVIACEKKKQLLDLIDIKQIQIKLDKPLTKIPRDIEKYIISKKGKNLILRYSKKDITTGQVLEKIISNRLRIVELSSKDADLEEVFLMLLKNN